MVDSARNKSSIDFKPLTPKRWNDFEILFGERGACGGCWCMLWRLSRKNFEQQKGEGNRLAMQAIVRSGEIPGILAYESGQPVGWCALAPRERYPALGRSRILKKVDETPVWSISCFFIHKGYRRQGLSVELISAAVNHIAEQGGKVVEAYPYVPKKDHAPPVFIWTGVASAFEKSNFVECARRSEHRPIMRYVIMS